MDFNGAKEFIELWHSSSSTIQVAKKLNISRAAVYARAKYLRNKGITLPVKTRGKELTDEEIKSLIEFSRDLENENGND